jgi:hypothetical protein
MKWTKCFGIQRLPVTFLDCCRLGMSSQSSILRFKCLYKKPEGNFAPLFYLV